MATIVYLSFFSFPSFLWPQDTRNRLHRLWRLLPCRPVSRRRSVAPEPVLQHRKSIYLSGASAFIVQGNRRGIDGSCVVIFRTCCKNGAGLGDASVFKGLGVEKS
jgi:hypothetical protein